MMHVWPMRLRRWELKGIVRNIVNAFGLFALGITYGLSDQYKEYYIAFDTNGELCLLGNNWQVFGSGLNGLNESYSQDNGSAKELYVYRKLGVKNCTYYSLIGFLYVRILTIEIRYNGYHWCNDAPNGMDRGFQEVNGKEPVETFLTRKKRG
ncbi:hypothetical protein YC2023_059972 [Brassica napus]